MNSDQDIELHQHKSESSNLNPKSQANKKPQAANNKKKRFVFAYDYYEQQSGALRNLIALVAWTNTVNGAVVELCVNESFFNMNNASIHH